MNLIMDALWWMGLVCVPASIISRATWDGQHQHPTPADRWNDRNHTPWPATWTRRALRVAYHLGRALGWALLLLLWIAIGLTLAALELGGETCKTLAYTVAALALALAYLVEHAKRLMTGPTPANAPALTT
ncbi:hypothetical protein [Nonomuraea basaltis]|uniref:hypothetical protein n=1 Tax=Nonomuraea basaltis TaxID=2495887 RepID=UPI00110C67CC|nr:hypothetical protein [Nonomuraea basaltis]TMR93306.1 hypothetical protein EJK15_40115 [Nonomuraea basaltis]